MGLFSIILLVLTTIFAELVQKQLEIQSMSAVESDKSYILSRLEYDIDQADTIIIPSGIGEVSPTLQLDIDGNLLSYQLDGTALELNINGTSQRLNNIRTAISNLSFQRIENSGGIPTITIYMDIASTVQEASGQRQTIINTTLGRR